MIIDLAKKLEKTPIISTVNKINQQIRDNEAMYNTKNEAIKDSLAQVKRKNKQMENEIERLEILQQKNSSSFNKKNSERIKYSKRIVELEEENELLEDKISLLESKIEDVDTELKNLSYPTLDELYFEVVKGFGVNFIKNDEGVVAKINNKSKNDVYQITCSDNLVETSEAIWSCIE